ncbi:MAG: hypothetical protein KBT04_06740 [Bacteroidales bacterium]|nr:hypothetical protein [Candidatus Colimorpha onthohippi]
MPRQAKPFDTRSTISTMFTLAETPGKIRYIVYNVLGLSEYRSSRFSGVVSPFTSTNHPKILCSTLPDLSVSTVLDDRATHGLW